MTWSTEGRPAPALFLEPTSVMPVSSQVGSMLGDDDQVKDAYFDEAAATRTGIPFASRVRLDRRDGLV